MKTIVLNIALDNHLKVDKVEMENNIARHFIAKGWGSEVEDVPKVKKGKK